MEFIEEMWVFVVRIDQCGKVMWEWFDVFKDEVWKLLIEWEVVEKVRIENIQVEIVKVCEFGWVKFGEILVQIVQCIVEFFMYDFFFYGEFKDEVEFVFEVVFNQFINVKIVVFNVECEVEQWKWDQEEFVCFCQIEE